MARLHACRVVLLWCDEVGNRPHVGGIEVTVPVERPSMAARIGFGFRTDVLAPCEQKRGCVAGGVVDFGSKDIEVSRCGGLYLQITTTMPFVHRVVCIECELLGMDGRAELVDIGIGNGDAIWVIIDWMSLIDRAGNLQAAFSRKVVDSECRRSIGTVEGYLLRIGYRAWVGIDGTCPDVVLGSHADYLVIRIGERFPMGTGCTGWIVQRDVGKGMTVDIAVFQLPVIEADVKLATDEDCRICELASRWSIEQLHDVVAGLDGLVRCYLGVVLDNHVVHLKVGLLLVHILAQCEITWGKLEIAASEVAEDLLSRFRVGRAPPALRTFLSR